MEPKIVNFEITQAIISMAPRWNVIWTIPNIFMKVTMIIFLCQNEIDQEVRKLVPHLDKIMKYVIHYRSRKQCLFAGLVLKKVHLIIRIELSPWLNRT